MDKNEEFKISANIVSDEELDSVSGGHEISEMPDDWQEGITPAGAIAEA